MFGSLYWRYRGSIVSVDHFLRRLRSGVAFTAGRMAEDQNMLADYQKHSISFGSITISPKVSAKGKYTFAPFVDFYFGHERDTVAQDHHTAWLHRWNEFRIKTGFLINSEKAYVGLSAQIFEYTSVPFEETSMKFFQNVKYILQGGCTFQHKPESKYSFTPQFAFGFARQHLTYLTQYYPSLFEDWRANYYYDFSLVFRYMKFITGLNTTGVMLGYQNTRFKLQISNSFWENPSYSSLTYSGSIGLRYVFRKNETTAIPAF